jgi:hypothetical protein
LASRTTPNPPGPKPSTNSPASNNTPEHGGGYADNAASDDPPSPSDVDIIDGRSIQEGKYRAERVNV